MINRYRSILIGFSLAWLAIPAGADEPLTIAVTIKDHRFTPAEIHVPQGKPVILKVTNEDATPEEFDSTALKVEKVIVGGTYGTIRLRPLALQRIKNLLHRVTHQNQPSAFSSQLSALQRCNLRDRQNENRHPSQTTEAEC